MSRSGYSDDYSSEDQWGYIKWRGQVASTIRGKRGQAFLREMLDAMDSMPTKELHAHILSEPDGRVCAMGTVVKARGLDVSNLDPEDYEAVARRLGITNQLAQEIAFMNDESGYNRMTPRERWEYMRRWIVQNLKPENRNHGDVPN